jgi:hypothetical protein
MGPPKVLAAPKPTSSVRISRILGAPAGAFGGSGQVKGFSRGCAVASSPPSDAREAAKRAATVNFINTFPYTVGAAITGSS